MPQLILSVDTHQPPVGTVRILAVHIDAGFAQLHGGLELVTQRIDNSVIELKAEMSVNMSTVMDQFALRSSSDRFIKVGFGVAVLGVLIQTAFAALK